MSIKTEFVQGIKEGRMSFIDDSVISGMDEMRDTYLKYKSLEEMADMNKTN